jgi:hypothetical protein
MLSTVFMTQLVSRGCVRAKTVWARLLTYVRRLSMSHTDTAIDHLVSVDPR